MRWRPGRRILATYATYIVRRTQIGVSVLAGELGRRFRGSHAPAVPDLLVAATAERLGLPLATRNVRDYPMFPGLEPAYRR